MTQLKKMLQTQIDFQKLIGIDYNNMTEEKKQQLTEKFILYAISELNELLQEINFKDHREKKDILVANIREEIIDSLKYVLTIPTFWGIDADELALEFDKKSEVVLQRYKQEMKLKLIHDRNIVALDVDGVLSDYPACWVTFINENYGTNLKTLSDAKQRFALSAYETIKHAYRASGYKATIPAKPFASEFTHELKKRGYTIVLLTARPYDRYANMFTDLITWAKNNDIVYDAIIFGKEKHLAVVTRFSKMKFMVEDSYEAAMEIMKQGYKVYLCETEENSHKAYHKDITRVKNLKEILDDLDKQAAKEKK